VSCSYIRSRRRNLSEMLCFLDSIVSRIELTRYARKDFEMWVYRCLLRIGWVDKIRNTKVSWYLLTRLGKTCEISNTVKIRKLRYFGHIMGYPERYELLRLIIEGKIEERRKTPKILDQKPKRMLREIMESSLEQQWIKSLNTIAERIGRAKKKSTNL